MPLPRNFTPAAAAAITGAHTRRRGVAASSEEGRRLWRMQLAIDASGPVKAMAKQLNAARHGGRCTCVACGFASADPAMLDAHHPTPLAVGVRTTLAEHLEILCPTRHRRAHRATDNRLEPESLAMVRRWVAAGRP